MIRTKEIIDKNKRASRNDIRGRDWKTKGQWRPRRLVDDDFMSFHAGNCLALRAHRRQKVDTNFYDKCPKIGARNDAKLGPEKAQHLTSERSQDLVSEGRVRNITM